MSKFRYSSGTMSNMPTASVGMAPNCIRGHLLCALSIAFCVLAAAPGCRRSDTVSVSGKVTLDGDALPNGSMVLIPKDRGSGPSVGCAIVEGHYSIPADHGPRRGVKYRVEIHSMYSVAGSTKETKDPLTGGNFPVVQDRVPPAYHSQSQLEMAVPVDAANVRQDFELQSKSTR